jgi:hypothetical protein
MKELVRGADRLTALQGVQRLGGIMNGMRRDDIQQPRDTAKRGRFNGPPRGSPEELKLIGRSAPQSPATRIALIRAIRSVQRANAIRRQAAPRQDGLSARVVADQSQGERVTAQLAAIAIFRLHRLGGEH